MIFSYDFVLLEPGDGAGGRDVADGQLAEESEVVTHSEAVVAGLAGDHHRGLRHYALYTLHPDGVLDGAPPVAHSTRVLPVI